MAKRRCDECRTRVRVAGGIGDMWSGGGPGEGMTLVYDDGTERFLCFDCIAALEDDAEPPDGGAGDDASRSRGDAGES